MIDRDGQTMDVLNRAIAALRDEPVPETPPRELVASTIEALKSSQAQTVWVNQRRKLMFRIARYSGVAAAAASVAVLAGWFLLMDRTASLAFADVIKNVNDAKSVTFVTKMPTIVKGTTRGVLQQKFYIQGDIYRMEIPTAQEGVEIPAGVPPIVAVMIADPKQKKAILLDYTTKTAKNVVGDEKTWERLSKALTDPIKQLRELKEKDAERLADEDLNGRKTHVYRIKKTEIFLGMTAGKADTAKLWVDPKTGLPVQIRVDSDDKDKNFCVFEQFTWNESLDPALFKLEVPKGFTIKAE